MTKGPTPFSCTVAQLTGQLKACLDSWLRNTQLVGGQPVDSYPKIQLVTKLWAPVENTAGDSQWTAS